MLKEASVKIQPFSAQPLPTIRFNLTPLRSACYGNRWPHKQRLSPSKHASFDSLRIRGWSVILSGQLD